MSERTIRVRLGELVDGATGTARVHTEAVTISSEDEAVSQLGGTAGADGLVPLHGWVIGPGKGPSRRLSLGWVLHERTYTILGYRSQEDGAETAMEAEIKAVCEAIQAAGAYATLTPRPMVTSVTSSMLPASLTGFPVWEATIEVVTQEYATA